MSEKKGFPPQEENEIQKRIEGFANDILVYIDTNLAELSQFRRRDSVVDLGCGAGFVGQAMKNKGSDSVASYYYGQIRPGTATPNLRYKDVLQGLDLPNDSVDFLFSRNGPHLWNYSESDAQKLFEEINRILSYQGQARFHVPWLGFVQLRIAQELEEQGKNKLQVVWRKLSKPTEWRCGMSPHDATEAKLRNIRPYPQRAIEESTAYLKQSGFDIELVSHSTRPDDVQAQYWLMKKAARK